MEPKFSLPLSQKPATCPYPEPEQSIPCPPSHFLKIHIYINLPSTPASSKWSLSLGFLVKILFRPLLSPIPATCLVHHTLLGLITRIMSGEEYRSFSSSLCCFLYTPVTSSFLSPNILLRTLFSNTLSLSSSLNASDQVSHPYKQQAKL